MNSLSISPNPALLSESRDLAPELRWGLKWSAGFHVALVLFVLVKDVVFPSRTVPYIPTLKVDLVGLPDVLKKDLANPAQAHLQKDILDVLKKAEQDANRIKTTKPVQKVEPKDSGTKKSLTGKNLRALERIKALSKIQGSVENETLVQKTTPLLKGNRLSGGSSLSGDAKEALEASYYDLVRDHMKQNWALPPWVARQDYQCQVYIYLDSRGHLRKFKFKKLSGNSQFDEAVKRAIQESQPYPAPPEGLVSTLLTDGILMGFPL